MLTLGEGIDLDALAHLDPGLRAEVEEVIASFRADILGSASSASDRSEQLARIRAALQHTPTLEKALDPPTLDEIGKVAQPERPLVYLGSAPKGSFAIIVDRDGDGGVEIDAIRAPDCDSGAIAQLVFGFDASGNPIHEDTTAYLLAQMSAPDELDGSIAALSALVGEHLLRPLAELLALRGRSAVTLIPTGTLGLMPLHAISWSDAAGSRRSLIDDFDVTFALSARLQRASMQRASQHGSDPIRFVGVANPPSESLSVAQRGARDQDRPGTRANQR